MAATKISALPADDVVGGSEQIPVNDAGTNKRITPAQILDYAKGTTNTWDAKQTFKLFEAASGTLTADSPIVISQNWNNAAVSFTGLKIDVTNTASASGSSCFSVASDGVNRVSILADSSRFYVDDLYYFELVQSGYPTFGCSANQWYLKAGAGLAAALIKSTQINFGFPIFFGSAAHLPEFAIGRDAANTLYQRNGTNPQAYRLYNSYTSGTNYERAKLSWESNRFVIATSAAGTGTKRGITLDATDLILSSLPTTDPAVAGRLWLDGTALKVSAG